MRTTFEVSHFLQSLIMVNVVLVTGVHSNFVELIHFLFLQSVNLCFFYFNLSSLLVLDYLVLQELVFFGFGLALLVLHQVFLHNFVPGFL